MLQYNYAYLYDPPNNLSPYEQESGFIRFCMSRTQMQENATNVYEWMN